MHPSNYMLMIVISISLPCLHGCAQPNYKAPIEEGSSIPSFRLQTHTVAPGETLYSIAWRYDLEYRKLAQLNGLTGAYRIHPGQEISLYKPVYKAPSVKPQPAPVQPKVAQKAPAPKPKVVPDRSKIKPVESISATAPKPATGAIRWQWPVKGELLSRFHGEGGLNRGIDISGKLGEPVFAAASGEVVYSGSGLRGYGKLIIVKHDEKYLSAYAHNRVLHVAEGDVVKAGQKIAEVGSTGANVPKLHFEIRRDGQPVDPLQHLPKD